MPRVLRLCILVVAALCGSRLSAQTDLYIQANSPGKGKESNWLPSPKDDFVLMFRLYWPKEKDPTILNGSWKIPGVKKL
ncbi:MAG TPA: DUF1214 domain-containing protein [Candidatus Acidoferrum sp.]|nr:DUF1214 domain-containing protein [Candidatus Acidoferrum sp.]